MSTVKMDFLHSGISLFQRFVKGFSKGGNAQHTSAAGHQLAVLQSRTGMVYGYAGNLAVFVQTGDFQSLWDRRPDIRRKP